MLKKIFTCIVVLALVALLFSLLPVTYSWAKSFVFWIMSWGQWGVISVITLIILAIVGFFE